MTRRPISIVTHDTAASGEGTSFDRLAEQVWEIMREMSGRNFFRSHGPRSWQPRVNVYSCDTRVVVCVELAGVRRRDIEVRVGGGALHIGGRRDRPLAPEEGDRLGAALEECGVEIMEIDSGRFSRSIPIPAGVMNEKVRASYRNGYLWVVLPLASNPPRTDPT